MRNFLATPEVCPNGASLSRRSLLAGAAVLPMAAPSLAAAQQADARIHALLRDIAVFRLQGEAADGRAKARRLALTAAVGPVDAEQDDAEWNTAMDDSYAADDAVDRCIAILERTPAAGLAGAVAKLGFALDGGLSDSDTKALAQSALTDLRRLVAG